MFDDETSINEYISSEILSIYGGFASSNICYKRFKLIYIYKLNEEPLVHQIFHVG